MHLREVILGPLYRPIIEKYGDHHWFRYTPVEDANVLYQQIVESRANGLLEIGTNRGHMSLLLHTLFPKLSITSIDFPMDDRPDLFDNLHALQRPEGMARNQIGELITQTLGRYPDNIHQLYGDSRRLESYPSNLTFDVAFIDGSHKYEDVILDTIVCLVMGSPNLRIVWHDAVDQNFGVKDAIKYLRPTMPIEIVDGTNVAIFRRPRL